MTFDILVDVIGTIEAAYRRLGYWRENVWGLLLKLHWHFLYG